MKRSAVLVLVAAVGLAACKPIDTSALTEIEQAVADRVDPWRPIAASAARSTPHTKTPAGSIRRAP